jgi:hypothetical protein
LTLDASDTAGNNATQVTATTNSSAVTCVALFPAVSDASSVNVTEPLSLDPTVYVVVYVVPDPDTALLETADSPIFIAIVGVVIVSLEVTLIVIISPSFANVEVALLEDRSTRVSVGTVVSMVTFEPDVISDCVACVALVNV